MKELTNSILRGTLLADMANHIQMMKPTLENLKRSQNKPEFKMPVDLGQNTSIPVAASKISGEDGGKFGNTRVGENGAKFHGGLDIKASKNTPVMSSAAGIVVRAEYSESYGNVIYINHSGGYQTRYAHLENISVSKGDLIDAGEIIGKTGTTGNADFPGVVPHLHFEIRQLNQWSSAAALSNGESTPLDPMLFLRTVK